MDPSTFEWLLQAGIPAGLGVIVVMYLLKYLIPNQQALFKQALTDQQAIFQTAISTEQQVHTASMEQLSGVLRDESTQTRQTISELSSQVQQLSEAVFKLYGKAG